MTKQQKAIEWWSSVPGAAKQAGAFLTGITGSAVVISAALNIPGRVSALEDWKEEQTRATAYTVCVLGSQTRNIDPAACESHLGGEMFDYLRPER